MRVAPSERLRVLRAPFIAAAYPDEGKLDLSVCRHLWLAVRLIWSGECDICSLPQGWCGQWNVKT